MAGFGILEGADKGFESSLMRPLGSTDFERRLNYQRALQEELRRTTTYLEEVEMARMHLVLPEESLFIEEEPPSSASIVLDLKPLAGKPEQVKGIILVSTSVEIFPEMSILLTLQGESSVKVCWKTRKLLRGGGQRQSEMKRDFENNSGRPGRQNAGKIMGPAKQL